MSISISPILIVGTIGRSVPVARRLMTARHGPSYDLKDEAIFRME
jgi:hypothetical protein